MKHYRNIFRKAICSFLLNGVIATNSNNYYGTNTSPASSNVNSDYPSTNINSNNNYNNASNNAANNNKNNSNNIYSSENPNDIVTKNVHSMNEENGALFGEISPFPVMDSNGKVTIVPSPQKDQDYNKQLQPQALINSQYTMSSANTPSFPSVLGTRYRGLPTHLDADLNTYIKDPQLNTPSFKRIQRAQASINGVYDEQNNSQTQYTLNQNMGSIGKIALTNEFDQGPLAPAPNSKMEQAGWWEYLAILFGESGDPTALRLILHRLTKLAQLQLGSIDSGRVKASTAFLARNFKTLLLDSFHDFVYDPDYNRNSSMWSSDPGFSKIIRRLVDQMDYFGAQAELEQLFGSNSGLALSMGMRQKEWLRLKLILEQIAWDMKHPNDLIGLWSPTWNLTVPQKLSILAFASNTGANAPLDLNLPNRDLVLARINLIINGEAPRDKNIILKESPLDQAHYKYAKLQANGNLCKSLAETNISRSNQNNSSASGMKQRVEDYCELVELTPNFNQFCQSGPYDSTQIAAILSSAAPLFRTGVIKYINHLERLFWAYNWSGSCIDSREALATLTNQIKVLGPRESIARTGKRVPIEVTDSVQVRLEYLQAIQLTCQNNLQTTGSADVAHIFTLMNYQHLDEALFEWERKYSSVAARLQGYSGGSAIVGGESQLLYQQARAVRIALLIYKYPRSVYIPCLSRGLLTRDPATDLTLLNLTHSLDTRPSGSVFEPLITDMSARSLFMRALYLTGRYTEATGVAREIAAVSGADDLVDEFLACTQLCGSTTRNPCEAIKLYQKLMRNPANGNKQPASAGNNSKVVYSVGSELSGRLCRLGKNTAADALSLRYGKVLTTQATFSAFKRIIDVNYYSDPDDSIDHSKLQGGQARSVVPWFGSLPPAPVEEIITFIPTRKLNFAIQVSLRGIPAIGSKQQGQQGNTGGNGNILVFGKQYNANYLTESNGNGANTAPKLKEANGYLQFESDLKTPNAQFDQNIENNDLNL